MCYYYEKNTIIRLPLPKKIFNKNNEDSYRNACNYCEKQLGVLYDDFEVGKFTVQNFGKKYYIDLFLQIERSSNTKNYGKVFNLNDKEIKKYKPLFDKLGFKYNKNNLKKIIYCYYNRYEPIDYYN